MSAKPVYFSLKAMAAALVQSESELMHNMRLGFITPPDTVFDGKPLWSLEALRLEINKFRGPDVDDLEWVNVAIAALVRAEKADAAC